MKYVYSLANPIATPTNQIGRGAKKQNYRPKNVEFFTWKSILTYH
jgi:hypothetical protein